MSKFTVHKNMPDSTLIRTHPSGEFIVGFPNGKSHRGKAADADAAMQEALESHKQYVYQQWAKGSPQAGQIWATSLK